MTVIKLAAAIATAGAICISGAALAADSTLVLVLGGEAYDGAPEFSVTFDGKPLGEGAVEAAIDTEAAGRLADVADKSPYVQSFTFPIPDAVFNPEGELGVRLTNEAFGGEGSDRDRNLFLVSASINGRVVLPTAFTTKGADGVAPNEMLGDLLVLYDNNAEGVSAAPEGGWPQPQAGVEAVSLAPDAVAAVEPADEAPARTTGGPVVLEPEPAALVAAAEPEVVDTPDTVETASLDPEEPQLTGEGCALDQIYNVIGFNENSNDLTPKLMERLDQIAADIGQETCTVQITGYSSTQGDYATNALFAIERAQNVLAYLRQKGLQFAEVNATGAGETTQFGDGFSVNRRVVITVTP